MTFDSARLRSILDAHRGQPGALIPILQETQEAYGFIPREAVLTVAKDLRMPASQVYGVATFYAQFHLTPRGRHVVRVCLGTACHVRGGERILERLGNVLGVAPGETTKDLLFTLERVACLGACGLSPTMMIDDATYGRLTPRAAVDIVQRYRCDAEEAATGGE